MKGLTVGNMGWSGNEQMTEDALRELMRNNAACGDAGAGWDEPLWEEIELLRGIIKKVSASASIYGMTDLSNDEVHAVERAMK